MKSRFVLCLLLLAILVPIVPMTVEARTMDMEQTISTPVWNPMTFLTEQLAMFKVWVAGVLNPAPKPPKKPPDTPTKDGKKVEEVTWGDLKNKYGGRR